MKLRLVAVLAVGRVLEDHLRTRFRPDDDTVHSCAVEDIFAQLEDNATTRNKLDHGRRFHQPIEPKRRDGGAGPFSPRERRSQLFANAAAHDGTSNAMNTTTTEAPTVFVATGGYLITQAPPPPEGVYNPCKGEKPPETYEEILAAEEEERQAERDRAAILNFVLMVLIVIVLLPTVIFPMLGMTFLSGPFAFLYKALAVNAIPESRYHAPLQQNPDVMDLEYPWYSFTEDMQLCVHVCCCYAARVAHTYDAAEIMPFWDAYKRAIIFNIFAAPAFCEQRYQLRKTKGLNHDWFDMTMQEQRRAMVESFVCCFCYAYQEAKELDDAAHVQIVCCCQVADTEDKYAEFPIVGAAVAAKKAEDTSSTVADKAGALSRQPSGAELGKEGVPLTQKTLQQLEQATGGERGQAIPADQQSFASKVIQDLESHAGGTSRASPAKKKALDDRSDVMSVASHKVLQKSVSKGNEPEAVMQRIGEDSPIGGMQQLEDAAEGAGDDDARELTEEQLAAQEERREKRARRLRERRALEATITEDERLRKRTRIQSIHAREKGKAPGIPFEVHSSKKRAQMERDRAAKEERKLAAERERLRAEGLLPPESTAYSSTEDAMTEVARTERSLRGAVNDLNRADGEASETDVYSMHTKQRSLKESTYATSETTDDSEYSSTYMAKRQAKQMRRKQRAAEKSYIDNADDISDASTTAKALARVKLPGGVFTKKQFKRLDEMKIRKLFREADADQSGSINIEEFGLFLDRRFGVRPNMSTLDMLLKMIDDNNDGEIDEEEFVAFFMLILKYANDAKKLNDLRSKKFFIAVCSNGALLLSFGFLTLFAYQSAKKCEEVCVDENIACPGETRAHCTLRCFEPKEPNTYVEYGLVASMMFWMLASGMLIFLFFLFCCPAIVTCLGMLCGGRKADKTPVIHYDDDGGVDPETQSPSRIRQQVSSMYQMALSKGHRVTTREDYLAAEREQTLNQLAKGNQIYFQPITAGGGRNKKRHDPRVPDPLKIMEGEFETEDAFLQALANNPLEPIAWVPPGLADDFVVEVVAKEEDEEEVNRKKRRKDKLKRMQKKQKKQDMLALRDSSPPALEDEKEEDYSYLLRAKGNKRQPIEDRFQHANTREIKSMGRQAMKQMQGLADGMASKVMEFDPEKAQERQDAVDDALLDEALEEAAGGAGVAGGSLSRERTIGQLATAETIADLGSLEEEQDGLGEDGEIVDQNAALFASRQQLMIPKTEDEVRRDAYYATPIYNHTVDTQRDQEQWGNWEQDFRAQQRSNIRKQVNQLIKIAGDDPDKYKSALTVAKQNFGIGYDEDDIRRMTRKHKELSEEKAAKAAEKQEQMEVYVKQVEQCMLSRDPYGLEEALKGLKEMTLGTRQHARLLSIARAELPVVQKEAEAARVGRGEQSLAPHWSKYVAPDVSEELAPGMGDPQAFQVPSRKKHDESTEEPVPEKKKKTGGKFKIK
ncbi:unnamed protein product [Amoebophrya sp. A120]|nr:unnamed protein product [Amoebophrya sp. A120]|eukprot:GSA120T00002214001.1